MGWSSIVLRLLSLKAFFLLCSVPVCVAQSLNNAFTLEPVCSNPGTVIPWWVSLQKVDAAGRDPCQLREALKNQSIFTSCCTGNQIQTMGPDFCGPCTLQMYNLAAACMACSGDGITLGPQSPVFNNASRYKHDRLGDGQAAVDIPFPGNSSFNQGKRQIPDLMKQFNLPSWLNASLTNDGFFDPIQAVFLAETPSPPPSSTSTHEASPSATTPSTSLTPVTKSTFNTKSSSSRSPIIAGAVIGSVVGVLLVSIVILYLRRRRPVQTVLPVSFVPSAPFASNKMRDELQRQPQPEMQWQTQPESASQQESLVPESVSQPPPYSPGSWRRQ